MAFLVIIFDNKVVNQRTHGRIIGKGVSCGMNSAYLRRLTKRKIIASAVLISSRVISPSVRCALGKHQLSRKRETHACTLASSIHLENRRGSRRQSNDHSSVTAISVLS